MAQTSQLISTLKRLLKRQGLTYTNVAACLDLSEASVKRVFAEQSLSLSRLDAICGLLGIEISDLVHEMQRDAKAPISELTLEQEKRIASDLSLMLVTVLALSRWTLAEMMAHYRLSENQCIQHLAHLDRLNIIELQPGNAIRLLVAPNFKWRDNGPILQLFREKIESEYFQTSFTKDSEQLLVLNGMLSDASNQQFQQKLAQLVNDFDELCKSDSGLPIGERNGSTVLLALRDWNYTQLFGSYRRA